MTREPNQPDPIDRTLTALNHAAPPEGMEARITQRLAAHTPSPSRFKSFRALTPAPAWLRAALTGALVATAACALAFYITRPQRTVQPPIATTSSQPPHSITATPVSLKTGDGCLGAPFMRGRQDAHGWGEPGPAAGTATTPGVAHSPRVLGAPFMRGRQDAHGWEPTDSRAPHLVPASFAPSKPAPPAPLTAQERALVQLAGNPAALAALNPAAQKSDAEREAAFQKFFAPSPELLAAQKAAEQAAHAGSTEPPASNGLQN
jgi:hypothetical protein